MRIFHGSLRKSFTKVVVKLTFPGQVRLGSFL